MDEARSSSLTTVAASSTASCNDVVNFWAVIARDVCPAAEHRAQHLALSSSNFGRRWLMMPILLPSARLTAALALRVCH